MKLPILLVAVAFAGCAANPGAPSGQPGGTAANGIEIWKGGNTPSRPFQVIATIQRQGADSSSTFQDEENLIAAEAQKQGADGMIVLNAVMVLSRMNVLTSRPIMAPKVEAELIKYD